MIYHHNISNTKEISNNILCFNTHFVDMPSLYLRVRHVSHHSHLCISLMAYTHTLLSSFALSPSLFCPKSVLGRERCLRGSKGRTRDSTPTFFFWRDSTPTFGMVRPNQGMWICFFFFLLSFSLSDSKISFNFLELLH